MQRIVLTCLGLGLLFSVTGCGDSLPKTHEGCLNEMEKVIEEASGILDKIKTKDDVARYRDDLEKLTKRAQALNDQLKKLDKPASGDEEKLNAKFQKLQLATAAMQNKMSKLPAEVQAEIEKHFSRMK